jgi:drug/metabolite transporter (DMT)-like permease
MTQNKSAAAYVALGVGVLALSFSAMFVRWAGVPGPVTAFYRMFFSVFLLFPLFAPRIKHTHALKRSAILFPLLAGASTAIDLGLWTTALGYTTVSNATLLGNTSPLWVALGAWLVFRQKQSGKFWLGLLLALSGATLILGTDFILHPRFGIGDVMAIFTGFFYGLYFLFTEKSREHFDSINHIWLVGVGASLTLFIINKLLGHPLTGFSTSTWLIFLSTAFVSQLIGYMAMAYAQGHVPASVVAPTMILQPVLSTILAIPLFGEIPGSWQIIGGTIALAGIYIVNQSHQRSRISEPLS